MGLGLLVGFRFWLVCNRLKLFRLLDYLLFDGIGRLLGILLLWILALSERGQESQNPSPSLDLNERSKARAEDVPHPTPLLSVHREDKGQRVDNSTHDFNFPAAESTTAPISFSTLAALISASPSF
jgi:hypothetical protein